MPHLTERLFRQFFKIGDYSYTFKPWIKSGIEIVWYDDKGILWQSGQFNSLINLFPTSQPDYSNNNFTIIYSNPGIPPNFHSFKQELTLIFNCWAYNKLGDSLRINNAKFSGICLY